MGLASAAGGDAAAKVQASANRVNGRANKADSRKQGRC
jgi:hypothetical protein